MTLITIWIVYAFTRDVPATLAAAGLDVTLRLGIWGFKRWRLKRKSAKTEPAVVWFTGLSGAGKTTLSQGLADRLRARGVPVEVLDGDSLRQIFPNTGFDRASREEHVRKVGLLARYLEKNGVFVVASLISPYEDSRQFVRGLCRNFIEVHLDTPIEECEKRDVKGLYRRARSGELKGFTGIDDPYERPQTPELRLNTAKLSVDQALERIEGRLWTTSTL